MLDEGQTVDRVVPRIVVNLPEAVVPNIELSQDDSPVERPLVADLLVWYAFDEPTCFTMVAHRHLARLGLDKERLHEIALSNLRRLIPETEVYELSNGVSALICGGNFEATTLLLDEVWGQMSPRVQGDLVMAVPARDVVIFTGSNNREGLAHMRSKVSEVLETGDHILTRHFLVRRGNAWEWMGCV
jgi:uncharacterized protein YtpQ (UPF0354 family)